MDMQFYLKLVLRRLPLMTALFLLCAGLGVALAIKLPTTYESTARLLVEAPQIPTNLASSTVQTSPTEELEVVRQQLLTRANLIEIANKLEVFPNLRMMSPDEVVEKMRSTTKIGYTEAPRRGNQQPTFVTVTFSAPTGQIAANVVNEYVTRIVEANVRQRTGRAGDTLAFFEQEVERLSGELALRSSRITEFQAANAEALPESLSYKLGRQTLLLERVANATRERTGLIEQRARLIAVFEATGQVTGVGGQSAQLSPAARALQQLEADLESALAIYSETNPRVVALKAQINQARQAVATESGSSVGDGVSTAQALLDLQLSDIDQRVLILDDEAARAEEELATLEREIAAAPQNGIVLESMQRDYAAIREQYDNAVTSLAQARLGERIELTSRGQRITLIENGNVPTAPASPNRPMIAAAGVAMGLMLAGGVFMLLELLNRKVRRPVEITKGLGITPLATIPFIETALQRRLRRGVRLATLGAVAIGVPAALWAVDTYYLPLHLIFDRLLAGIGIA